MEEIRIGEKTYISSKKAAEITGYAKDYVGQLCREGHVEAKMVGRSWYVYEPSIRAHRFGVEPADSGEETEAPDVQEEEIGAMKAIIDATTTWERPTYASEEPTTIPDLGSSAPRGTVNLIERDSKPEIAQLSDMQRAWEAWFDLKRGREAEPVSVEALLEDDQEDVQDDEVLEEDEDDAVEDKYEPIEEAPEALEAAADEEEAVPVPFTAIGSKQPVEADSEVQEETQEEEQVPFQRIPARTPVPQQSRAHYLKEDFFAPRTDTTRLAPRIQTVTPAAPTPRPVRKANTTKKGGGLAIRAVFVSIAVIAIAIGLIGSGIASPYLQTAQKNDKLEQGINILVGERELNR